MDFASFVSENWFCELIGPRPKIGRGCGNDSKSGVFNFDATAYDVPWAVLQKLGPCKVGATFSLIMIFG